MQISKYISRITTVLKWHTFSLFIVILSPALLLIFQVGISTHIHISERMRDVGLSVDYFAFMLIIISFSTFWKWLYDAAFMLHRKFYPERHKQSWWQIVILIPLAPLAIALGLNALPAPTSFYAIEAFAVFVSSWFLMCLLCFIRTTWLLGKLEGKNRYFRWFISLLAWPVGIWWIQPVLREAWNRDIEKENMDHFMV